MFIITSALRSYNAPAKTTAISMAISMNPGYFMIPVQFFGKCFKPCARRRFICDLFSHFVGIINIKRFWVMIHPRGLMGWAAIPVHASIAWTWVSTSWGQSTSRTRISALVDQQPVPSIDVATSTTYIRRAP
jgi:hypothetical protein